MIDKIKQGVGQNMTDFSLSVDKLLIYDPDKSKSVCHVFVAHPSPAEEKSLGKLFILSEIRSKDRINHEIINDIQNEIKHSYYNTDDLNVETAFEKALERLNQKVADLVGNYDTNWLDKINCVIAVIRNDSIYFSSVGVIHSFLIHNERITDILSSAGIEHQHINPLKAFTEVVSGNLTPGDNLIFCTSNLLDYLSQEKLKRTIIEHTPQNAVSMIENLLSENEGMVAYGAIIIKLIEGTAPAMKQVAATPVTAAIPHTTTQSSMNQLITQAHSTDKILSPSLTSHIFKIITGFWHNLSKFIKLKIFRQSPRRVSFSNKQKFLQPARQESLKSPRQSSSILKNIGLGIASLFAWLFQLLKNIPRLFKKRDKIGHEIKTAPENFSKFFTNLILGIKRLPRISKILLLLAIVVAFILSQSLFSLGLTKQDDQQQADNIQTAAQISQKILKAEAAFSYGNEEGGKELLREAQDLLNMLPTKQDEDKERIKELQDNINSQLNKTKHIIEITSPAEITDFSSLEGAINPAALVYTSDNLYSFDPSTNKIYQVSISDRTISTLSEKESANKFQYVTVQTNTSLLFLDTTNSLIEYNLASNKLTDQTFSLTSQDVNIADIGTYQSRVYLLDIKNNQIYRTSKAGTNSYGTPANWLQEEDTDIRNSKSITIDGSIYVLKENGEVYKLFGGNKQDWSLDTIDPALTKADKILTNTEADNLYIMDIQGQRIVEFDKNGALLNQYTSAAFNDMVDFSVDFSNKKIYILNGKKILQADLQL